MPGVPVREVRSPEGRRLLVLEPYYGGSHRAVLETLLPRLAPEWQADVLTLPARKWKWRMRGSAITMAQEVRALHTAGVRWDALLASTFINLAEFVALAGEAVAGVPRVVYFHENQLVYPNRHEAEWDLQFPLTNITTALTADECWFNTRWNAETFLEGIAPFLARFPDHIPRDVRSRVATKCRVLSPPFDPLEIDEAVGPCGVASAPRGPRPRIVWPHRWEHDKRPDRFFAAVTALASEGADFEVAVVGQAFRETSDLMRSSAQALGDRLVHCDEPASRADYARLLACSDIAISTADNEFFGLAMLEACHAGCHPLVPDRLAYPELYPLAFRYSGDAGLLSELRALVSERPSPGSARAISESFTAQALLPSWRDALRTLAARASDR